MSSACRSTGVARVDVNYSLNVFEHSFDAPKTTPGKYGNLLAFRRSQRRVYDRVRDRNSGTGHITAKRDDYGNQEKNSKATTSHKSCLSTKRKLFQYFGRKVSRQTEYYAPVGFPYHPT
jgi:hypothetical protein